MTLWTSLAGLWIKSTRFEPEMPINNYVPFTNYSFLYLETDGVNSRKHVFFG